MPLAFESLNRGRIAFGFFQIESDMLLLQELFFFADAFCEGVGAVLEGSPEREASAVWPGWAIERREDVGDLMGAIRGERLEGFLGATYRRYPFPAREGDFKQSPEGFETQAELRAMIEPYAKPREIALSADPTVGEVSLGDYRFSREGFGALVRYVWRGGWPRWRDEVRPVYVKAMRDRIEASTHWLAEGLELV